MLDGLVRGVGVVRGRGADAGHLAGGDRDAGARAADHDRALGGAVEHRVAPRRARRRGSRRGRSSSCRGRRARGPPPCTVSSTTGLSGNPAWSNAHAICIDGRLPSLDWWRPLLRRDSRGARARRPAGPWRASRIFVSRPTPGTVCLRAARSAGTSSRSPASETPPPITTSSGSNVLIAFAIPIPSRSPSTRITLPAAARSPSRAPSTASWPVISSPAASRRPRNDCGCARAASSASRSSARPDASASSDPGCGNVAADPRARRRSRSSPMHRVAELDARSSPAVELAVEHEAAADAGADREHHEVLADDLARDLRLGQRRARGVVLDVDRQPAALAQRVAQRHVAQRQVDAVAHAAGREVDDRRQADRDRAASTCRDSARSRSTIWSTSCSPECVRVGIGSNVSKRPVLEHRGGDLRAADVDPDERAVAHSRSSAAAGASSTSISLPAPGRTSAAGADSSGGVAERARDRRRPCRRRRRGRRPRARC